MTTTHHATCPLCEATCGIDVTVDAGRITDIRGDKQDVFSEGYICPKAAALKDLHEDPDRLKTPVRRTVSGWEPLSWSEALTEAADGLRSITDRHGRDAFGVYLGNPTVHSLGASIYSQLFLRAVRTKNRFSATSADQLPHMLASLELFGHQLSLPVPDIDRTAYWLILGANPLASNGSLMTAPNVKARMARIRQRGGRVVVIDPRRTQTASAADQHEFIRPGTDAFFLLGLIKHLLDAGHRGGLLAPRLHGLEELKKCADAFSQEEIADATQIAQKTTEAIAGAFTAAKTSVCYGRMGVCTQEFGGLSAWLINCVNILAGRLDVPGGAMFPQPAVDLRPLVARAGSRGSYNRYQSRGEGLPEFGGELPVAALADELERPGPRQVRALLTHAGNPVLSTPNGRRLDRALESLSYMVSIDFYVNETTRHANIILPPTAGLERDHYDFIFSHFAVRNVAKWSPQVMPIENEQRHDWQIWAALSRQLAPGKSPKARVQKLLHRASGALGPKPILDLALRTSARGLSLRRLTQAPHGIDLGPLAPCLDQVLFHKDRRIPIAPALFIKDLARLRARLGRASETLLLIGRRHVRSNNSWMHNSRRLVKGPPRCTLLMHSEDAARLSLSDSDRAKLSSKAGSLEVTVEISDTMMQGVVSLPHGWGHQRDGVRLRVAKEHPGVSLNDVTDEGFVDVLSGNAALNGTPVMVTPLATPG